MAYKWGLLTTYKSWDDPPSTNSNINSNTGIGSDEFLLWGPASMLVLGSVGGGFTYFLIFTPKFWGNISNLTSILFQMG